MLVNAIVLPNGFEEKEELDDEELLLNREATFEPRNYGGGVVTYATYILLEALNEIYKHVDSRLYKKQYSITARDSCYRCLFNKIF